MLQHGQVNVPVVFDCADGHIVLIPSGPTLAVMVTWFVEEGLVPESWIDGEEWPTYHFRLLQGQPLSCSLEEVLDAITKYVVNYTKNQLLDRGLREGVTLAPVSDMADLGRVPASGGTWVLAVGALAQRHGDAGAGGGCAYVGNPDEREELGSGAG